MKINKSKKTVAVIFGGNSVESDISIITGVQVLNALDKNRFNILPIYINKMGCWLTHEKFFDITYFSTNKELAAQRVALLGQNLFKVFPKKQKLFCKIDFAYLALHGGSGEDGSMQGFLNVQGVPYSSAGVLGSATTLDKLSTKRLLNALSIPTPNYASINASELTHFEDVLKHQLGEISFPLIAKPNSLGSSIGISFCKNLKELKNALSFAFMFSKIAIIEEVVKPLKEYNLSLLKTSNGLETSLIEQVETSQNFLTFENKYLNHEKSPSPKGMEGMKHQIKPNLPKQIEEQIVQFGKQIYNGFDLSGCVRIDYLFNPKTNQLFVNEVNSIPGSMANYLWQNKYSFTTLLNKIYDSAMEEFELKNKLIKTFSSTVLSNFSNKNGLKNLKK